MTTAQLAYTSSVPVETKEIAGTDTPPSTRFSYRRVVIQAVALWLVTRVLILLFTYMAVLFAQDKTPTYIFDPLTIVHHWDQWDADWYFAVARLGYYSPAATVYFPLYPLLIHGGTQIFGAQSQLFIALLISHLGTLAAFIGMGLLAAHEGRTERASAPAIRVMAAYPLAFFLAAPYTEGLFLGLAVWSFYGARRGSWLLAGTCAFFAALTRPTGAILWLPICWEYGRQHGWWSRIARHRRDLHRVVPAYLRALRQRARQGLNLATVYDALCGGVALGGVPFAFGTYALYCYLRFGDALSFVHQEGAWFHKAMPLWDLIAVTWNYYQTIPNWSFWQARFFVDLVPLIAFTVITIIGAVRWPVSYTLYMIGLLYLCIASPTINGSFPFPLMSVSRYLVVAFPVFLLMGRGVARHAWLDQLLVTGGFMLQALFMAFFLAGGWIV